MKKNNLTKRLVCLLLCCVMVFSLTACSSAKSDCKKVLSNLETACNEGDVDGIIDCINPSETVFLRAALVLFSDSSEMILDLFEELGMPIAADTSEDTDEGSSKEKAITIKPTDYDLDDEDGTVTATITVKTGDTTIEKEAVFEMIKVDDTWYIDSISAQ